MNDFFKCYLIGYFIGILTGAALAAVWVWAAVTH